MHVPHNICEGNKATGVSLCVSFAVKSLLVIPRIIVMMDLLHFSALFECDFGINENTDMCSMEQGQNNDIDWELTQTSEDADTGPSSDHTENTGNAGISL